MTTIAGNIGDIFLARRLTLRTAIFLVFLNRTPTRFVSAFTIISHYLKSSLVRKKNICRFPTILIIDRYSDTDNKKLKILNNQKAQLLIVPFEFD